MNEYPMRAMRTSRWKYIRNLRPDASHHTHIDRAQDGDGRGYWSAWMRAAETDPKAAEVIQRYHHRPAEELYDLHADPWELTNLADDPGHQEQLEQCRQELEAWMNSEADNGLAAEEAHKKK